MLEVLEAGSVFVLRKRTTEPGGPLRTSYFQSLGAIETVNFLRFAPEIRLVQGLVTGKWLLKTSRINCKT
jgi:hypothetical protein